MVAPFLALETFERVSEAVREVLIVRGRLFSLCLLVVSAEPDRAKVRIESTTIVQTEMRCLSMIRSWSGIFSCGLLF
jgi:hypothetical protein